MKDPLSLSYRRRQLGVLLLVQTFVYMDRYALAVVLESIKADMRLNDTQLGMLAGISIAAFYSVLGIPLARLADRGNRARLIAFAMSAWGLFVILCGRASTFLQLMWVRCGAGVGEAGCVPAGHSLIADSVPRPARPAAIGIYMQGVNLSLLLGYFLGGWLNARFGWRTMFELLALPGLALGVAAGWLLYEPRSTRATEVLPVRQPPEAPTSSSRERSLIAVLGLLLSNRTYRHLLLGFSLWYFFGYGIAQWQPTFFVRSYSISSGALGTWFAAILGLCGVMGTYLGGWWATRNAAANERLQLQVVAAANVIFNSLVWSGIYLVHSEYVAFALMGFATFGVMIINGPMLATIQVVVPGDIRATAVAVLYLSGNIVGVGLGPWVVGAASDLLAPIAGADSLRFALLLFCPGFIWSAWHIWHASRTVEADINAAGQSDGAVLCAEHA